MLWDFGRSESSCPKLETLKKFCPNGVDPGTLVIYSIFLKNKDIEKKKPNRISYKPFSPEGLVVMVRERLNRKRV